MFRKIALAALAWAAATAAPASAEQACDLKLVATVDLAIDRNMHAIFMPVTLNGVNKYMVIDTGGIFNTMGRDTAAQLRLSPRPSPLRLENVAGQVYAEYVAVRNFSFGGLPDIHADFILHPEMDWAINVGGDLAGTIAPNLLRGFDVEFDFAAGQMKLFKPSNCINGPYWSSTNAATIDIDVRADGHIVFPMMLDGKPVRSALDTGMSVTALRADAVEKLLGINPNALYRQQEAIGYARDGIVVLHSLATEKNEISIGNPRILLLPVQASGQVSGIPDLILGLSTLKQLHLYIAYHRQKLFVTPASGPPAVTVQLQIPERRPQMANSNKASETNTSSADPPAEKAAK